MWTPETLLLVAGVFLFAGFVKGLVGLGLPTVSVALLAATLGLKEAIALMLAPSFATNLLLAVGGGAFGAIMRRLWPMLAALCIGAWLGAGLLARADAALLTILLGVILAVYASLGIAAPRMPRVGRREPWLSAPVGAVNGVITGLTGTYVVPGMLYLEALDFPREELVQAMGVLFGVATAALAVALAGHRLLPAELGFASLAALVPALIGMAAGQHLRRRTSERRFRQLLFGALLLLGIYLVVRSARALG
jgi:uncharacterized membrane protein YfcA